jgi:hypothetical protein
MKTWRYESGTWQEAPLGLPIPGGAWSGQRQMTVEGIKEHGYEFMQKYAGPGAMFVWLYEAKESNTLGADFVALVGCGREDHLVMFLSLPDMLDWLARYVPTFRETYPPLEDGMVKEGGQP